MIMRDIPLPRLLPGTGYDGRRIRPIKLSVYLNITPLSYATMELPEDESIPARGYVELYTCMGSAGIFRARAPEDAYGDNVPTVELEHAVVEVGDYLVLEKLDEMKGAKAAMTTIFGHYRGSKWQLGNINALGNGEIAMQANYNRVLEAMLSIMEQKPDCMMTFDFTTSPKWTINIVQRGQTVEAEGRLSRNVNYANITYDDTELCTRAYYEKEATTDEVLEGYPVFDSIKNYSKNAYVTHNSKLYKLPNGHVKGVTWANTTKTAITDIPTSVWAYVDADTMSTYGLIERSVPTGSSFTAEEALKTATEYINKHKNPRVSIEVSLEELSSTTGEPMDTFTIGKLCRLALADYNVTVEKNIIGMGFPDVFEQPTNVTVNLAEEEDATVNFIHDVDAKGGSGGGGGGKKQDEKWKEYRTKFEQDDYHFKLYAERVNTAEEILQQAGLYIDSNGVLIYAQDNENNIGSKIKVQADRISLLVEGEGPNAEVKRAAIILAINNGTSSVVIEADEIDIDGLVEELSAKIITAIELHSTGAIYADGDFEGDGDISIAGVVGCNGVETNSLELAGDDAEWKSKPVCTSITVTHIGVNTYKLANDSTLQANFVTGVTGNYTTINYVGGPDS